MYNELDYDQDDEYKKLTVDDCYCAACEKTRFALGLPQRSFGLLANELVYQTRMIVCRKCKDKRCPQATNHLFACKLDKEGVE